MAEHGTIAAPGFPTQCTYCAMNRSNRHPPADGYFKQCNGRRTRIGVCRKHAICVGSQVTWYGEPRDCDGNLIAEGDVVYQLHTSNGVTITGRRGFLVNAVLKRHRAQCRLSNGKTAFCDRLSLAKGELSEPGG